MKEIIDKLARIEENVKNIDVSMRQHREDDKEFHGSQQKRIDNIEIYINETIAIRKFKSRIFKVAATLLGTPLGFWVLMKLGLEL